MSNRIAVALRVLLFTTASLVPAVVFAQAAPEPEIAPQASVISPSGIFNLPDAPLLSAPEPAADSTAAPLADAPAAVPPMPEQPAAAAPMPGAAPAPPGPAAPPATATAQPPASAGPPPLSPERVTITADKPVVSTGVAAIVNDYVISDYDLNQRVALFIATSGVRPTPESLAQIRTQVLRSVEDEVLQLQEAARHKITVSKAEVDRALQNISNDNKIPMDQLLGTVTNAGVTVETTGLSAVIVTRSGDSGGGPAEAGG